MDTCVICLDDLKDEVKFLRCAHKFHKNCIDVWIHKNPRCPICKTSINENNTEHPRISVASIIFDNINQNLSSSPYGAFIRLLTDQFVRNIIGTNTETMRERIEEKTAPINRLLVRAIELEKKLSDAGVNLSNIPLDQLNSSAPARTISFIYMKLLELRDANFPRNS